MDTKITILCVDDDPLNRDIIYRVLEGAGFHVLLGANGEDAVRIAREQPVDLVLLDVMMPVLDGLRASLAIRAFSNVPVIFLTALEAEDDLLAGFAAGGQDYITKPFRSRELIARIRAAIARDKAAPPRLARQTGPLTGPLLKYKNLTLDRRSHLVRKDGMLLTLSPTSFLLLEFFLARPGRLVTKNDLLKHVWALENARQAENMVEAAIKRLRRELGDDSREPAYIQTVWGRGYRFGDPP